MPGIQPPPFRVRSRIDAGCMLKASAVTIGRPPSHPFHFLKRMQGYILSDDIALKIVTHLDLCTILSLSRVSALVTALVEF